MSSDRERIDPAGNRPGKIDPSDIRLEPLTREPPPPDFAEGWIDRYAASRRDHGPLEGFAALDAQGTFLGLALAPHIDRYAGELELGYMVAAHARGRGAATAMLTALTSWAFEVLALQRAYLIINVENVASERVAERCGYTREGVMRSILAKAGSERIDAGLWSRLPDDPPPRQSRACDLL